MKIEDKIIKIKTNEIKPYKQNSKKHPEKQIDNIVNSIKEYGFNVPLILDDKKEIICGHGRYEAAKKIGMEELPCILKDDLTPAQVKAFRIADNKVTESEWDYDLLKLEFEDLKLENFDLDLTGFFSEDIAEVNDFVGGSNPEEIYKPDKEAPKENLPDKKIMDADLFELINSKQNIYVQFSGGKDSMAQVAKMLDNGISPEKMIIVHNSTPNDYDDLIDFVKDFAKKIQARDCVIIGDYTEEDGLKIFKKNGFPLPHMVWCTSSWKIQPMRKYFKTLNASIDDSVICQGWRKEESERRDSASDRVIDQNGYLLCRPIMDMSTEEVYEIIKKHDWELHHSYSYRKRLSCLYCFAIPREEWDDMREKDPVNFFKALKIVCAGAGSHNIKGETFKNTVRKMMGMGTINNDNI